MSVTFPQVLGNIGSTKELFEPNHAGVIGGVSRWFTLQPDDNGTLLIDTQGSAINTVMAVYTGENILNLTQIASDHNSGPDGISAFVSIRAVKNTTYLVAVDSEDGASGLINLNWRLGVAPAITAQPMSRIVRRLNDASFSVAATGDPAPGFQWRKDGVDLFGETGATLSFADTPLDATGNYTVAVSNLVGVEISQVATLTVEDIVHFDLEKTMPTRLPDGRFRFRIIVPVNQSYVIEASPNLKDWTPVFTVPADPNGDILFTDENSAELGGRFYRVRPAG